MGSMYNKFPTSLYEKKKNQNTRIEISQPLGMNTFADTEKREKNQVITRITKHRKRNRQQQKSAKL